VTPDRAAVYLRVSTSEQDLRGQALELRNYAAARGWQIVGLYAESVTANGSVPRIEYDRLLKDAKNPERGWARLLVWSLDRFSRAARFTDATQAILELEALGVRFHSLREPFLDTPEEGEPSFGRQVLLALLPVIASFEAKRRSERTLVAMRAFKDGTRVPKGKVGRPRRVTEEKAREIVALHFEGVPWPEIAQRVGLPKETCRKAAWTIAHAARRSTPSVLNPPAGNTTSAPSEEPPSAQPTPSAPAPEEPEA
jgi:DNA invertase Pin-like site-specific DNA recombinase